MTNLSLWTLLAGLGIFLFGIHLLEESIRQLSGRAFKQFIRRYTSNRPRSIFTGFLATGILQSSSAVSLTVLAFVGAGIMALENAIGVIMGANLGTTVTGWLVATLGFKVDIESFALPMIALGGLGLIFFQRRDRFLQTSRLLLGFGFLFLGLDYMKSSVDAFTENIDASTLPLDRLAPALFIGFGLSALTQSSSLALAIVLTALHAQMINFHTGAAMIIGANVGTTVKILLGSIGGSLLKRRVAFSHFLFNFITAILALLALSPLSRLAQWPFPSPGDEVLSLALFHTLFNLLGILVLLPFIGGLVKIINRLFAEKKIPLTLYLKDVSPEVSEAALPAVRKETAHLLAQVLRFHLRLLRIDEKLVFPEERQWAPPGRANADHAAEYLYIKQLQSEIVAFSTHIHEVSLSPEEGRQLGHYLHAARLALQAAKTFKDVKHNFDDFEQSENPFLNSRYQQFRRRIITLYIAIEQLLTPGDGPGGEPGSEILRLSRLPREEDRQFLQAMTQAVRQQQLLDTDVSTALLVNRAFLQAAQQMLLATRELLLSEEQLAAFDIAEETLEANW
jgi:phosphate:Na+ symporter